MMLNRHHPFRVCLTPRKFCLDFHVFARICLAKGELSRAKTLHAVFEVLALLQKAAQSTLDVARTYTLNSWIRLVGDILGDMKPKKNERPKKDEWDIITKKAATNAKIIKDACHCDPHYSMRATMFSADTCGYHIPPSVPAMNGNAVNV